MRYIVDGYNLMYVSKEHQPFRKGKDLEGCRATLVRKLSAFAAISGETVLVVFDGTGAGGMERRAGVSIVFSPGPSGADAEIVRRVDADRSRKTLTVVSSDREVAFAVRRLGAVSVSSGAFMGQVEQALAAAPDDEPDRNRIPDEAETEFWLEIFDELEDR